MLKEAQAEWAKYAYNQARRVGIDDPQYPLMFVAKLMQESSFNPTSSNQNGGVGIAQLKPEVAGQLGIDPRDPVASIDASLRIDAQNYQALGGNLLATIAAYHVGQATVAEAMQAGTELPIEAQTYLNRILTIQHPKFVEMFGDVVEEGRRNLPTDADVPPSDMVAAAAANKRERSSLRGQFNDVITRGGEAQVSEYLHRFVSEYSSFDR